MGWFRTKNGMTTLWIVVISLFVTSVSSIGKVNAAHTQAGPRTAINDLVVGSGDTTDSTVDATTTTTSADLFAGGGTTVPGRAGATSTTDPDGKVAVPDYGLKTQGVTDKEVKVGLTYNVSGCGDSGALQAALGQAVTGDPQKAFDAFVKYVNDTGGIGGRKFVLDVADDGSGGCPEKAAAASVKLVDQDKVFMLIPGINDVSDYSISKKIPTLIGRDDEESLKKFGPNGFGLNGIVQTLDVWSSFGAHYLKSGQNTPCLVHPDDTDWNRSEATLIKAMARFNIKFKKIVRYKDDVATAQTQASAAVASFRQAGCNHIYFMAWNPIALIFFTSAASQGLWYPDVWTFTSYSVLTDTALAGNLMDQNQWQNAIGLSGRVPKGQHPAEGNCKRIYSKYYPGDGQEESASVQIACAEILLAAQIMKRAIARTGVLTGNSFVVGADSINEDYYFDATVPLDWSLPGGGPYKTKAQTDWTVVKWNRQSKDYDFPNFPLYWKSFGPNNSGGRDLRPLFKPAAP